MLASLPHRQVFIGLFLLAIVSMAFAMLYLEGVLNLVACPLCMSQRVFVVGWAVIALIAAVHNPQQWGYRVYALLCAASASIGGAIAARHVWLQNLPEDQVPACGPSLEYMLDNFPFQEAISLMLMGDGNCAEVSWTFLGMSIPEQTLLLFAVTIVISLWLAFRHEPARRQN
ncbi:MAG: disulfide bond formation protein B [Halioglobus sp.]